MSSIYPTNSNANIDALFGSNNTNNPLLNPEMAGYIDILYGLFSDDTTGTGHTEIFQGLLQYADPSDPSVQSALRMIMNIVGSSSFGSALEAEYTAQSKLPPSQQCSQFMSLYQLLKQPGAITTLDGTQSFSILDFSQNYVAKPTADGVTEISNALQGGGPLDGFIANIGSNNTPGLGYNSTQVSVYTEPADLNQSLKTDFDNIKRFLSANPPDYRRVFSNIESIENLGKNNPAVQNDPNYVLVMQMLEQPSFNPGGTIAGTSITTAYSLLDFANAYTTGSASDKTAIATAAGISFNSMLDIGGPDGKETESWAQMIGTTLPAFINKW